MPPQGGGDFDDVEIARAVAYMANSAGAKFAEPQRPLQRPPPQRSRRGRQLGHGCRRSCRSGAAAAPQPPQRRPPLPAPAKPSTSRPASPATPPAWPMRPSSATRPPGRRASRRACRPGAVGHQGQGRDAAQGWLARASDADIRAAVEYMVKHGQVSARTRKPVMTGFFMASRAAAPALRIASCLRQLRAAHIAEALRQVAREHSCGTHRPCSIASAACTMSCVCTRPKPRSVSR